MKVLQINATYGYGSTGLIMSDIGEAVKDSGNEAYFAYQSSRTQVENGYRIGSTFDWKAHAFLCRLLGKQGYYSIFATRKFLKHLDKISPDVVHLHNLHSNFINLNMLLKHLAKKDIPTVITMHDCWYFTGKCFHYVDVNCTKFTSGCGNCPKKSDSPRSLIFDSSARVLKDREKYLSSIPRLKIAGCSEWICNEAKKGIMRGFDITTIRNGVDTDIFKSRDKQALKKFFGFEDKFVIMGMANKWLSPLNAVFLEKIVTSLSEDEKIIIVGCKETHKAMLEKYSDRVMSVGFVTDRSKLAEYYAMSDVFVNVTHADTLPTVNMESICCGTPVVTYNSCGSPELVLEGCGHVVLENDVDEIINKIKLVKKEGCAGCAEIGKKSFEKQMCYEGYSDLYREIVEP